MATETVLLVEDEPSLRALIGRMLVAAGFHVLQARNGAGALDWSRGRHVALVITDVSMPQVEGIALVEQLSRTSPAPRLLVMSARRLEAQRPAGAMFVRKPFSGQELLGYVHVLMAAPLRAG